MKTSKTQRAKVPLLIPNDYEPLSESYRTTIPSFTFLAYVALLQAASLAV